MSSSWFAPIDSYCERTDAGFWSEPLNAISNSAFLLAAVAAFLLWRQAGGRDRPALWLIAVAALVGIGSFLFHTFANGWSLIADVLPIAIFIYSYFLLAMGRYLGFRPIPAIAATVAFVLFNSGFDRIWFTAFPGVTLNGSFGYLPAAAAMALVGCGCLVRARWLKSDALAGAGRVLLAAAGLFAVSLVFRTMDRDVCSTFPVGTHFLWHVLNAAVLFILMRAAIVFETVRREPSVGGRVHAGH